MNPRYLIPFIVTVALSLAAMKADEVWGVVSSGRLFSSLALAETQSGSPSPSSDTPVSQDNKKTDTPSSDKSSAVGDKDAPLVSTVPDMEDRSQAEVEVLNQLAVRRESLEKRSRDLDNRENLIKVTEQRVDQKIKELETLRIQLQAMVSQASEAQTTQLENLVKIYETMKPEEAARIFETMDMPILLGVIKQMKPVKTAPVLAKMAPEKAKEITIALTKQDQLPQIK